MTDPVKEIVGVIKNSLINPMQEAFVFRARNPFFGSLIVSWIFYNWDKLAFFVLSDMPVVARIDYVRHKIPDNSVFFGYSIQHTHTLIYPVIWAAILTITYPFVIYLSINIHKSIMAKIENANKIKQKNSIQLQKDIVILEADNESAKQMQLAKNDAEIADYREKTEVSRSNIKLLSEKKKSLETEVNSLELQKNSVQTILSASSSELDRVTEALTVTQQELSDLLDEYKSFKELSDNFEKIKSDSDLLISERDELILKAQENEMRLEEVIASNQYLSIQKDELELSNKEMQKELGSLKQRDTSRNLNGIALVATNPRIFSINDDGVILINPKAREIISNIKVHD